MDEGRGGAQEGGAGEEFSFLRIFMEQNHNHFKEGRLELRGSRLVVNLLDPERDGGVFKCVVSNLVRRDFG